MNTIPPQGIGAVSPIFEGKSSSPNGNFIQTGIHHENGIPWLATLQTLGRVRTNLRCAPGRDLRTCITRVGFRALHKKK